ncbi:helix-turn-helix transcriptional regulator [Colwellia sp. BRX10-3]|uniref:AraC family transcriptional regulator n=1 Tax=Colwellia sp. BRX10-3 TaxID=2759844 RepID=UPI0015F6CE43|nr:AraC family transcriptional regulator [Colwellia sp. BRX10-3]MBA6392377.1 helix-turn-helix transcriptional regulator [Colwellia sp. BRX10-3]
MSNIKLTKSADIRLFIPVFLLKKLAKHRLTDGLYPVSLGITQANNNYKLQQENNHSHSLIYCLSGAGKLHYQGKVRIIERGDLVIINPNTAFTFTLDKTQENLIKSSHNDKQPSSRDSKATDNIVYWINFTGTLAQDFAERLLMKMDSGVAHVGVLKNIVSDFDHLLALGARGYTATNVIHAVHILQQALSFLALQLRLTMLNNSSSFDLEAVEALMRNSLHQELSLDTLAHYSQLSKFHFAKKFKELTDSSPIQHFINMKIQHACSQLDNSDIAIKDIANDLGYSDPYYFSRLFKKLVGISPKQYRDSRHSS